jgi:UDP:flavonoid glycosyltransferase YjiC (YdhE family)
MARILFAWELGGELGHALACATLANTLALRGHRIALAFRDLAPLAYLPEAKGFDTLQAPYARSEGRLGERPVSYAEILLDNGYREPRVLIELVRGWDALLEKSQPDLVVADYAPTALLAARIRGVRRVTYGNGFFTPPPLSPIPPYRFDEPVDPARVKAAEAAVLATVNAALAAFGSAPLARLADLFEAQENFLCTLPELDHYGERPTSGYWGPRHRFDRGAEVAWPTAGGKRIFVYVKTSMPRLDALLELLAAGTHRVVAFIPGLDPARRERLASRVRLVVERPVRLDALMRGCDLVVCHGGEMAAGILLAGVPELLFPMHYEQYLTARRLEQVGSAAWVGAAAPVERMREAFAALLANPGYAAAAKAFAKRYAAFSPAEQRRRIAARIDDILSRT